MSLHYVKEELAKAGLSGSLELFNIITNQNESITVPKKAIHNFRYIPNKDFKLVHPNLEVAKELTLLTLSNLSNTWLRSQHSDDERIILGYKRLYSRILESQVKVCGNRSSPYKKILKLLLKHDYIEIGEDAVYIPNGKGKAREFRLTLKYFGKGCERYFLKTPEVRRMRNIEFNENFERVLQTAIGRNHLRLLTKVTWPTDDEVRACIDEAVKSRWCNRDHKRMVWLGKHSKKEYPHSQFVHGEDYMKSFRFLRDHMKVPVVKKEWMDDDGNLKFRIATCFNLMPKLIRNLIKIGNHSIVENDFSAMHPNIIQKIYGGSNLEPISHQSVSEYLGISKDDAKKEHLSFFNKRICQMKASPLWNYYEVKEPKMLENILQEKCQHGHEKTCWRVFEIETRLMETIVSRLSAMGIDVIYVYDALYSTAEEQEVVKEVMNSVVREFNIHSRVK
ncbi:hypothetical protein [Salinimicrobium soli]|uniref:hypothetical protein n=1 Tax=Salinimicrobium soli TaxID=1254399 RepID=UPI003AAF451D